VPGSDRIRIDPKLPAGAYLLRAGSGVENRARARPDHRRHDRHANGFVEGGRVRVQCADRRAAIAQARLRIWESHGENGRDVFAFVRRHDQR